MNDLGDVVSAAGSMDDASCDEGEKKVFGVGRRKPERGGRGLGQMESQNTFYRNTRDRFRLQY